MLSRKEDFDKQAKPCFAEFNSPDRNHHFYKRVKKINFTTNFYIFSGGCNFLYSSMRGGVIKLGNI